MSQDVKAFEFPAGASVGKLQFVSTTDQGDVVTGLAQLAQRVAMELLTERGSMTYLPNRGTTLISQMRSGAIRNDHSLLVAFAAASVDLVSNLRSEESVNDPSNERIGSISLTKVEVDGLGGIKLTVKVYSRAGSYATLDLPLTINT